MPKQANLSRPSSSGTTEERPCKSEMLLHGRFLYVYFSSRV
nr:MAG TPA: hypothetical protein [Caudoviricetes sp.]